jgi:hypothetical protein
MSYNLHQEPDERGLIIDDGEIRNCPNNHAKMTIWEIAMNHTTYASYIQKIDMDVFRVLRDGFLMIVNIILLLALLPVWPFIGAYFTRRKAIRLVAEEQERKRHHAQAQEQERKRAGGEV